MARFPKNAMNRGVGGLKIENYAGKGYWEPYV